jgi:tetratricopeptide (TPR) repeat protein
MPSSSGYLVAAAAAAAALFFIMWWMLLSGGDEAPWVPAGLAASVVMLVAVSAREVIMRRAWTRHLLEHNGHDERSRAPQRRSSSDAGLRSPNVHAAVLRTLQKQSTAANAPGSLPEAHLEAYHLCQNYLANSDLTLNSAGLHTEIRLALRTGQERVRALQKHHLLNWAKGASQGLTHEAQQKVRVSDKIEMAMRALDCIDSALKLYPDEADLNDSGNAVREYMVSVKVAHWVELAERAAFKGHYRRAVDRYRDALFYLTRGSVDETNRAATAEKIGRAIELLRAKLKTDKNNRDQDFAQAVGKGEEESKNAGATMPKV